MIHMHSMTFAALKSVKAIDFILQENSVCPGTSKPFWGDDEIVVDDRFPRNDMVERLCEWQLKEADTPPYIHVEVPADEEPQREKLRIIGGPTTQTLKILLGDKPINFCVKSADIFLNPADHVMAKLTVYVDELDLQCEIAPPAIEFYRKHRGNEEPL